MITTIVSHALLSAYNDHDADLWYTPPRGPAYWRHDRQWANDIWLASAHTLAWLLSEGGVEDIPEQVIGIAVLSRYDPDDVAQTSWRDPNIDIVIVQARTATIAFGRVDHRDLRSAMDGTWIEPTWTMQQGWTHDNPSVIHGTWAEIIEHLDPDQ